MQLEEKCPNCGGRLYCHGWRKRASKRYRRYRCPECGLVLNPNARQPNPKRFADLAPDERSVVNERLVSKSRYLKIWGTGSRRKGVLSEIEEKCGWTQRKTMRAILINALEAGEDVGVFKDPAFLFNIVTTQGEFVDSLSERSRRHLASLQKSVSGESWKGLWTELRAAVEAKREKRQNASAKRLDSLIDRFFERDGQPDLNRILRAKDT